MNNKAIRFLVMGVSGSGKSTLGKALADKLCCEFIDGDDLHTKANIEKMRQSIALTTQDRQPWLQNIAKRYKKAMSEQQSLVIACSALKKEYRDILRDGDKNLVTVFLELDELALLKRMQQRNHFMPSSLLQSQLDTLEPPINEANTIVLSGEQAIESQLDKLLSNVII